MIYSFKNDYNTIAHKSILKALMDNMDEQNNGYGLDHHSDNAKRIMKEKMNYENCDIHFLVGGTQTNLCVISLLKSYQAVICATSGHINVHETGAIENTGHKVLTCNTTDGKINVQAIKEVYDLHVDEHMVMPKMVYISNSSETGSIYTLDELKQISAYCKVHNMYLFLDGARLACALSAEDNDITLNDLCKYCDVFYIGATKNGGLIGEAVVLVNDDLKSDFRYLIKNKGALLAKGYVNGIIFEELFKDNLYFDLGKHSNMCARYLYDSLVELGFTFTSKCNTNQIFLEISNEIYDSIKDDYITELWEDAQNYKVIRLVTTYSTSMEKCTEFVQYMKKFK